MGSSCRPWGTEAPGAGKEEQGDLEGWPATASFSHGSLWLSFNISLLAKRKTTRHIILSEFFGFFLFFFSNVGDNQASSLRFQEIATHTEPGAHPASDVG